MRTIGAIIAGLLASAAAAQPVEVDAASARARAALERGDPAAAIAELTPAARAAPANADVLRLLGLAQGRAGRTDEALATLERAQALAPGDVDIRFARAQVHFYRAEVAKAQALVDEVLRVAPDYAEVRELAQRLIRARREGLGARWRFDLSASYSDFEDNARRRWLEGGLGAGYRFDERTTGYGRIDVAERFDLTDVHLEAGIDRRLDDKWDAGLSVGATAGPDFLPQWVLQGRVRNRVADGTALFLDARYADYRTGSVETLAPGVEQYFLDGRLWLTGKLVVTWDEDGDRQEGYILRGDVQASDGLQLFAGYADAPETINNATLTTETIFGGAIVQLNDRYSLRLDYARDDREASYVRHVFALGVTVRY